MEADNINLLPPRLLQGMRYDVNLDDNQNMVNTNITAGIINTADQNRFVVFRLVCHTDGQFRQRHETALNNIISYLDTWNQEQNRNYIDTVCVEYAGRGNFKVNAFFSNMLFILPNVDSFVFQVPRVEGQTRRLMRDRSGYNHGVFLGRNVNNYSTEYELARTPFLHRCVTMLFHPDQGFPNVEDLRCVGGRPLPDNNGGMTRHIFDPYNPMQFQGANPNIAAWCIPRFVMGTCQNNNLNAFWQDVVLDDIFPQLRSMTNCFNGPSMMRDVDITYNRTITMTDSFSRMMMRDFVSDTVYQTHGECFSHCVGHHARWNAVKTSPFDFKTFRPAMIILTRPPEDMAQPILPEPGPYVVLNGNDGQYTGYRYNEEVGTRGITRMLDLGINFDVLRQAYTCQTRCFVQFVDDQDREFYVRANPTIENGGGDNNVQPGRDIEEYYEAELHRQLAGRPNLPIRLLAVQYLYGPQGFQKRLSQEIDESDDN